MSATDSAEYLPGRLLDLHDGGTAGAVLLWHGSGPNERSVLAGIAGTLADAGLLVLVPDWDSTGSDARTELLTSLDHARRLAAERGIERLVLAGWSLGGTAAAALALTDPRVDRVVCLAGDYLYPDPITRHRPVDLIAASTTQARFRLVHGDQDEVVPVLGARTFAQALGKYGHDVDLHVVPSDHAGVVMSEHDASAGLCVPSRSPASRAGGGASVAAIVNAYLA